MKDERRKIQKQKQKEFPLGKLTEKKRKKKKTTTTTTTNNELEVKKLKYNPRVA